MTKPSTPTVRVEQVKLTPALAEEYLKHNTHNRMVKPSKLNELIGAIKRGEWFVNGEAIKFAEDGTMLDGQHRCMAVIESGEAIDTMVVHGLPRETQETMDRGARRSLADALHLRGETSVTNLAATINLIHRWVEQSDSPQELRNRQVPTTVQAMTFFYSKREGIIEANRRGLNYRSKFPVKIPASVVSACWYVFSQIDQEDAEFFFDRFAHGTELRSDSPIYALRRTLIAGSVDYDSIKIHALIIKAWNLYRRGDTVTLLVWKQGGAQPEAFPTPM